MSSPPSRGLLYMLLAALFFSVMSALVKAIGDTIPSSQSVFARSLIGLALTTWLLRRARRSPWGNRRGLLLTRGLFGLGGLLCFFYALTRLPLADATVIMYTNPIWTALLAGLLLRERVSPRVLVCSVAALIGVLLVARPSFLFGGGTPLPLGPVLIALAGALFAAGAYVSVRALRRSEDVLVVVFWFPLVATPATLPIMLPDAVWPNPLELAALLGIGVTVQFAQVFLTKGLHLEPAGRATAVSYVQVVFAGLWGALAFGEIPPATSLLGAGIIIAAAVVVARGREPPPPAT